MRRSPAGRPAWCWWARRRGLCAGIAGELRVGRQPGGASGQQSRQRRGASADRGALATAATHADHSSDTPAAAPLSQRACSGHTAVEVAVVVGEQVRAAHAGQDVAGAAAMRGAAPPTSIGAKVRHISSSRSASMNVPSRLGPPSAQHPGQSPRGQRGQHGAPDRPRPGRRPNSRAPRRPAPAGRAASPRPRRRSAPAAAPRCGSAPAGRGRGAGAGDQRDRRDLALAAGLPVLALRRRSSGRRRSSRRARCRRRRR